jgi:CBS domain-containing protein
MQRIQKAISEILEDRPVPRVSRDDTVATAVGVMRRLGSDAVLICDDDRLVGIFTGRDFLNRVIGADRDPAETPIGSVMTRRPEALHPRDCITYVINLMAVRRYRNVPIIDDAERPLALLSVRDVVRHLAVVFAEIEQPVPSIADEEWTDIGGGG